jgi:hypothetical protein
VAFPRDVTCEDKARDKAASYLLSDANTPVLGDLCRVILGKLGAPSKKLNLGPYSETDDTEEQYPNAPSEWMLTVAHRQLPGFDWRLFELWCANPGAVLSPPLCIDLTKPAKRDCFVDGNPVTGVPYIENDVLASADARAEVNELADIMSHTYLDSNATSEVAWLGVDAEDYDLCFETERMRDAIAAEGLEPLEQVSGMSLLPAVRKRFLFHFDDKGKEEETPFEVPLGCDSLRAHHHLVGRSGGPKLSAVVHVQEATTGEVVYLGQAQ